MALSGEQHHFEILSLPKPSPDPPHDPNWITLAQKFRDLRLLSLKQAPEAFASTYEAESQRGLEQTFERLGNSKATQFIALEPEHKLGQIRALGEQALLDGLFKCSWIGMVVLLGPMEEAVTAKADPFEKIGRDSSIGSDITVLDSDTTETAPCQEFVLNGVFVEALARGRGVAKALIDASLETVRARGAQTGCSAVVTVLVSVENTGARRLYESSGFAVVGEETYRQEPRALLGESQAVDKVALRLRLEMGL